MIAGNKYLLDTNIVSAWLKNESQIVTNVAVALGIFIPVIVIGELYFGALYSTKVQKNLEDLHNLTNKHDILPVNEMTAITYGEIRFSLRKKGKPIPENDIWIAAIAQQHDITLVTRDKHFDAIEDLKLEKW